MQTFHLGELVYLTNRLARGDPDIPFTDKSGPGMIVEVTQENVTYKPRYLVRWLKSGVEMEFHADSLVRITDP